MHSHPNLCSLNFMHSLSEKIAALLYSLVGWCSLYLKKSFILLFLFSFKCSHWLQLNEDLEGHIDFLAQTGPFSVPIRCVTKKCQVFSCCNHHPLTTHLWYCCATSWGYSLVLHCASTTAHNIATSKMAEIVTGCQGRGIKGPFFDSLYRHHVNEIF